MHCGECDRKKAKEVRVVSRSIKIAALDNARAASR